MSENRKGVYESAAGTAGVGVGVTEVLRGRLQEQQRALSERRRAR